MVSRQISFFIVALGFGLIGAACTQTQANTGSSHFAARHQMTGSNIPQAPAYGDGVSDADTRSTLATMEQSSATRTGGGLSGGGSGR